MKTYLYKIITDEINGFPAGLIKIVLWIFSSVYGFVVTILLWTYSQGVFKRHDFKKRVISIGNITLGGAGKTPLVEWIARRLQEKKLKPAILTRGYMNESAIASDEATMLAVSLGKDIPVIAGANRIKSAQQILNKQSVDAFVLDDGFQHWRVARDLDIVLINCSNPFGNGYLFPRGILREPKSSLRRADVFVLTKVDIGKLNVDKIKLELAKQNPRALIVETIHQPGGLVDLLKSNEVQPLSFLKQRQICAFSSIADPSSFLHALSSLGATVKKHFAYLDHHVYSENDILEILRACEHEQIKTIVPTQKDAVKLNLFLNLFKHDVSLLSLKIQLKIIKGEHEFLSRIYNLFNC